MKYEETHAIYNKIKETSGMGDLALSIFGVTKEKIDTAMQQCCESGMSRKKAAEVIYKLWKNAEK